jgi:exodeoxyribonuclease VII large subunit
LRDVLNVLSRRFPLVEVILAPTPVQGEEAPDGIITALGALNTYVQPDVILLVRGGGSIEDLWAFNDEGVARAIAASEVPVVTGIGHETDVLIADFVADVRAPTPSAAAEVATPDRSTLIEELGDVALGLGRSFKERLWHLRRELDELLAVLLVVSPRMQVAGARQRVDELLLRTMAAVRHNLTLRRAAVDGATQTLRAIGPLEVLARGYAVVKRTDDDAVVRSVKQVDAGDELEIRVKDGTFGAEVAGASNKSD